MIRPGGILFVAVPDKRFSFDQKRPVTTLEHLYRDYEEGPAWSYLDHIREYAEHWNFADEPLDDYVRRLVETNYSIHFHVWTQADFIEMLTDIRRRLALPFDIEAFSSNDAIGETIAVLRKRSGLVNEGQVAAIGTWLSRRLDSAKAFRGGNRSFLHLVKQRLGLARVHRGSRATRIG